MKKRLISFLLALTLLLCTSVGFNSAALSPTAEKTFYNAVDNVIDALLKGIISIIPNPGWQKAEEYKSENFYGGFGSYLSSPAQNAKWNLGYSRVSVIPKDVLIGTYCLGGFFNFPNLNVTGVIDDQCFRVIAVNDGSGRGTVIYGVLDGVGISNKDIRTIRALLADFVQDTDIVAINISSTHAHSCIDVQGLGGDLIKAAFGNPLITALGMSKEYYSGRSEAFIQATARKAANAIKEAYRALEPGELYYSSVDVKEYIRDKRTPDVFDTEISTLRFDPDSESSRETWIANLGAHPVSFGSENTEISGDYPYYIEETINSKKNADFMFIQGAQCEITTNRGIVGEFPTNLEQIVAYGHTLGDKIITGTADEERLTPLLNASNTEVLVPVDNYILYLATKAKLVNNTVVRTGWRVDDVRIVTEVGYMEFGGRITAALIPGEFSPELAFGGTLPASEAWNGVDWNHKPMCETVGSDKRLLVFGLANDSIGYILPGNDYGSMLADGHYAETVSGGSQVGDCLVSAFESVYNG